MRAAIDIRKVPADIRDRVYRDAADKGISANDVVGEIVSVRYGVPWTPSGYPYTEASRQSDHWNLRVPVVVRDALRAHAQAIGGTITGCVLLALAAHYDLPYGSPKRRSSGPRLDPAMVREARRRHLEDGESLRSLSARYRVKRETLTKAIRAGGGA